MDTTSFRFGRSAAPDSGKRGSARHGAEAHLAALDDDIDDGPIPRGSGFVWVPLILIAFLSVAGLFYALFRLVF